MKGMGRIWLVAAVNWIYAEGKMLQSVKLKLYLITWITRVAILFGSDAIIQSEEKIYIVQRK